MVGSMSAAPRRTVVDVLRDRGGDDRPFLVFGARTVSYAELSSRAEAIAIALTSRNGVRPGDRVVTVMENGPDLVATCFGAWLAGATLAPLDPRLKRAQVSALNDRIAPRVVLAEAPAASPDGARAEPPAARDDAVIIFTSGTTGSPKGVVIEHGTLLVTAEALARGSWDAMEDDVVYCPWSLSHSTGLRTVLGALAVGASCVVADRFDERTFWRDVDIHGVTCTTVLGMSRRLVRALPDPVPPLRLHHLYATPSYPDATEAFNRLGIKVTEGYGLTETGQCLANPDPVAHPGSIGLPVPYYEVTLQDEGGAEVLDAGAFGEICCRPRAPGIIFSAYLGDPELRAAATRDLWFHTGDLAYRDAGGYYHLVGRSSDTIRRSSEMIAAAAVESALGGHPWVERCCVWAVPDAERGEEIEVTLTWSAGAPGHPETDRFHAVAAWARERVPASWVPRFWRAVSPDEMPMTISGKVKKLELMRTTAGRPAFDMRDHVARPAANR